MVTNTVVKKRVLCTRLAISKSQNIGIFADEKYLDIQRGTPILSWDFCVGLAFATNFLMSTTSEKKVIVFEYNSYLD